jgi:hypothetical protein
MKLPAHRADWYLGRKFVSKVGGLPAVMPAKAGIQVLLYFLDSGSR